MLDTACPEATLPLDAASAGATVFELERSSAPEPALPRRGRPYVLLSVLMWGLVLATFALAIAARVYSMAQLLACVTYVASYWAWAGRHLWMHGLGLPRR